MYSAHANDLPSRIKDATLDLVWLSQGNVKGVIRALLSVLMSRRRTTGSSVTESSALKSHFASLSHFLTGSDTEVLLVNGHSHKTV